MAGLGNSDNLLAGVGSHYHLLMSPSDKENLFLAGLLDHWKGFDRLLNAKLR
jgi:hypothetical protein